MSEERKLLFQVIETTDRLTENLEDWNEILEDWNTYLNQLEDRIHSDETRIHYLEVVVMSLVKKIEFLESKKTPV